MNAHTHQSPLPKNGDLFLLIKKQNLPKLQKLTQLRKNAKCTHSKNPQIDRYKICPKSQKDILAQSVPTYTMPFRTKISRQYQQVSIIGDLNDAQIQKHQKLTHDDKNQYVINISACPSNQSLKGQQPPDRHQKLSFIQQNNTTDLQPQIIEKSENFRAFFQYILDFKLMKKESYSQNQPKPSVQKNSESFKITSTKLPNSLAVKFHQKQDENNPLKSQLHKSQFDQNKQQRNHELQNSQISLVDVRVSNASIEDFPTIIKSQNISKNLSPSSEMKKIKKVYFDFQNLRFSQPDGSLEETNPIVQSQNNLTILNRTSSRIVSLSQLKKQIHNTENQNRIDTHHGYFCDECKVQPIVGKRYRCIQCDEYDLCQQCYKKECDQYRKILNQYENKKQSCQQERVLKLNTIYLFQTKPLLRKQISKIVEQENLSQNYSSQEFLQSSSERNLDNEQKDHVHLMQEVLKPKPIHYLNFQKILRQTNRCSLREINEKDSNKERQNITNKKYLLNQTSQHQKLLKSIHHSKSRLAFSERTISLNLTERSHRKILESKRKEIQNIRKSTQSISSLIK